MHYSKIDKCDFANGPGVRVSVFVSGCSNHCEGCFNKEAWDPTFGQDFTDETIEEILSAIEERDCDGLSILGGDPLEYYNLKDVDKLIRAFRKKFGFDKTIWMWTGYTIEHIMGNPLRCEVARLVDVLVEGPFILNKKDLTLPFRGSSNQQIIDMQLSQTFGMMILKEEYM